MYVGSLVSRLPMQIVEEYGWPQGTSLVVTIYSKRQPCLNFAVYTGYMLPRPLDAHAPLVYYNAYSGNESPNCWSGRHGHLSRAIASHRRVTKAGQTTLGQAMTVLSTSRILS